jgi:hypothetical protein
VIPHAIEINSFSGVKDSALLIGSSRRVSRMSGYKNIPFAITTLTARIIISQESTRLGIVLSTIIPTDLK